MPTPHTKSATIAHSLDSIRIANERFGYALALRHVLVAQGLPKEKVERLLELAKARQIDQFIMVFNK